MKYNTALPFFHKEDIEKILPQLEEILKGNALFTKGNRVIEFEKSFSKYIGTNFGVAVNSGTSALEISLKAIGIKKGDEVIVPVQTFISTGSCIVNNGGTPVFCEINENYLMDFNDLKEKITNKTKVVIIVHFCGLIHPDILQIRKYLKDKKIFLIEDAAHAHGAKVDNIYAGNIGDFGCFSFYSTKIMTTGGEGGFITVNNPDYFNLCASLSAIGINKQSKTEIYTAAGSNNRMTEFQAIMGISQLQRLDSFIKHRNVIVDVYRKKLSQLKEKGIIKFQEYPENIRHPYWRFLVILTNSNIDRDSLREKLRRESINIDWPYQPLLHQQPVFSNQITGSFKRSEIISQKHICLPVHLKIFSHDAEYIANKFVECF